jgi:glucosamine-6-phosphate deaminase
LDEYVGLPQGHPESYTEVIRRTVTEPLGLDPARVHVPGGWAADLVGAGEAYEQAIAAAGGIDVQILGIGQNGHVGFNEPGSSLGSRTRSKVLTSTTRSDNARFFESLEQVPIRCMTQGLGTIMDARRTVLVAQGESKAHAVAAMVEGPVTAMVPASVLQAHPHATVVIDEAAAAELQMSEYYRWAYAHRILGATTRAER